MCSCREWQKHFICKHSIAVSKVNELCEIPTQAMDIPIGQNRKRGRPKNTTTALMYQAQEFKSASTTESDSSPNTSITISSSISSSSETLYRIATPKKPKNRVTKAPQSKKRKIC